MSRVRIPRKLLYLIGGVAGLLLALTIAALLVLPSSWFREKVRARIIADVERASGGKAEIGAFRFEWTSLTAEVAPFVLRGTEPVSEPPLFAADSLRVRLKIISILKKDVDIAGLYIDRPRLNLIIDETGITNLPRPKLQRATSRDPIETLLRLAVAEVRLRNGDLHYGDQRIALDVDGRELNASLAYNLNGPSYEGNVSMRQVVADAGPALPMTFDFAGALSLFRDRIVVRSGHLGMKVTSVDFHGSIDGLKAPNLAFEVSALGDLSEVGKPLRLPLEHTGRAAFQGKLLYAREPGLRIEGRLTGQHLAYRQGPVRLSNISTAGDIAFTPARTAVRNLTVHALDGIFRGSADIEKFESFRLSGALTGVAVPSLARMTGTQRFGFSGTLNGPVELRGSFDNLRDLHASARFQVLASKGSVPVRGFIEPTWNGRTQTLAVKSSRLYLPSTSVEFQGTLGQTMDVTFESTDLHDLQPLLGETALPLRIRPGGSASFKGVVSGSLANMRAQGTAVLTNVEAEAQQLDRLTATVDATHSGLKIESFALGQDTLRMTGALNVALHDWRFTSGSTFSGNLQMRDARVAKLLAAAGQKLPIEGLASGKFEVSGTPDAPVVKAAVRVQDPRLYGQPFDSVEATVDYAGTGMEVINGVARIGNARVMLSGTWRHPPGDYRNGSIKFALSTDRTDLGQVAYLNTGWPGLGGGFEAKGQGTVDVRDGSILPQSVDGTVQLRKVVLNGRAIGDFAMDAKTVGRQMTIGVSGVAAGAKVAGNAAVQLSAEYPVIGTATLASVPLEVLQDFLRPDSPLPVDGYLQANAHFSGPLRRPAQLRAEIEIPAMELIPGRKTMSEKQRRELTVRNDGPVRLLYADRALKVQQAHMVGSDTDLRLAGGLSLAPKPALDLSVSGNLNLGILQDLDTDVVSSGKAVINAAVRGTPTRPDVTGRMEVRNASFYLADFPNGLEAANGVVLFDQRRATIEKLTARTGGGELLLNGFVGFGGNELLYQLQGRAERVRIRYPEGVSTTANASLTLTGTTSRSLLTGVVTVVRAGFNPRTDIGGILASAPSPGVAPATQNPFLRGLQFDVRVETAPNLQFQTSLTSDLQAEADLRIRGSAVKPVVLGRIVVSQGEIQFFGNRYTINRGEIGFFNPVRVEPVVDLDLETRVRAVVVNIKFNGPLQKLNVSYRSDPPLQSAEIIALLAVGRAPGSNSSLASSQTVSSQAFLGAGGNSLLGQAVAAPISSRLQRFFGVSRLKIDPQLTGLSAVPQARLTIEQQISRDVTLTYVTNLSQANQQIIRLEWNISRTWSVVAVREENGVFGVDFFYKKRFR